MYATVADVQRLEPLRQIAANSEPSTEQVVAYLEDCASEIDAVLAAANYKLPVQTASAGTATLALNLLRVVEAQGAHARVSSAAAATREGAPAAAWQRYQDSLRALADGRAELPDAAIDPTQLVA
jgi:phage gp36-like protein